MTPMSGLGFANTKPAFIEGPMTNTYSIDLDGTNDFINLGNSSEIKLATTDTSAGTGISVSCWWKFDGWDGTPSGYPGGNMNLVACIKVGGWKMVFENSRISCYLNIADNGSSKYLQIHGPFKSVDDGDQSYRAAGWIHTIMTYEGRTLRLYVNGREETGRGGSTDVDSGADDTDARYATGNNNVDILIGGNPTALSGGVSGTSTSDSNHFAGLIDQVAIWNKALDSDAVTEVYEAINTDGYHLDLTELFEDYDYQDNLVGWWKHEEGSGTSTIDSSSNSNTGSIKNGGAYSTTVPS